MILTFTVPGNHLGKDENPVPYHSAQPTKVVTITKNLSGDIINKSIRSFPNRDKQVLKYHDYCQHVRDYLIENLQGFTSLQRLLRMGERIQVAQNVRTQLYQLNMIYFKHDTRGDAENVSKGCIDAIHKEDKYVQGAFPYTYDKERPRVEIMITNEVEVYVARFNKFHADLAAGKLL